MRLCNRGDIYSIHRITSRQDNILGLSFTTEDNPINNIEVVEWWDITKGEDNTIRTSKEEVLKQVTEGLSWINEFFRTNYQLSKIYYLPSESCANDIYIALSRNLIRSYYKGLTFEEISE